MHFLLGPAIVALAIPLYRQLHLVRNSFAALVASVIMGSMAAIITVVTVAWLLGADGVMIASLVPKSATAAIAMGISEKIGGIPALTAVFAIVTGVIGAMFGPPLLKILGINQPEAEGIALGTASHGIGTARAMQDNEIAGAFSGIAMGLNGVATAILVPVVWALYSYVW